MKKLIALVVEDDEKSAKLFRLLLEAEGFSVLWAVDSEDALRIAPQHALSLITLDLQLPGNINGWSFLRRLHDISTLAQVPVIIISGQPVNELAAVHGAAAMLQKPIRRAELRAALSGLGLAPAHQSPEL
jgi:DNA-binding response OmpR family regulator